MKKRWFGILATAMTASVLLAGCRGKAETYEENETVITEEAEAFGFSYHFADKAEAEKCYLSNEEYFKGFSECDIQYKTQDKNGTIEGLKKIGASQMLEFSDDEKASIKKTMDEMKAELESNGYTIPDMGEITLIKSTQDEECGSGAYTHGTQIYIGQLLTDYICSDDEGAHIYGKCILWHEMFHCLTRNNPDFRKDMYGIIHFTVQDKDFELPPSVFEKYISNPDVEHHNSYATFEIDGKKIDCFAALIATVPFENEGDSFFSCMSTALVPVDGSDVYYLPEDADNFWEIFGKNTGYVIDPEECLADNFSYALTYGIDGMEYENPEIIKAILDYLSKK